MADREDSKAAIPRKHDEGKVDWSVVKWGPLKEVIGVIVLGNEEYGIDNWLEGQGLSRLRLFSAAMRHLIQWRIGADYDHKTGKSHLAHTVTNLLMLLYYERNNYDNDDRKR